MSNYLQQSINAEFLKLKMFGQHNTAIRFIAEIAESAIFIADPVSCLVSPDETFLAYSNTYHKVELSDEHGRVVDEFSTELTIRNAMEVCPDLDLRKCCLYTSRCPSLEGLRLLSQWAVRNIFVVDPAGIPPQTSQVRMMIKHHGFKVMSSVMVEA